MAPTSWRIVEHHSVGGEEFTTFDSTPTTLFSHQMTSKEELLVKRMEAVMVEMKNVSQESIITIINN